MSSYAQFPAVPFVITVGTEQMNVTAIATTTWTVTRGYNSTAAATHSNGVLVSYSLAGIRCASVSGITPTYTGHTAGTVRAWESRIGGRCDMNLAESMSAERTGPPPPSSWCAAAPAGSAAGL